MNDEHEHSTNITKSMIARNLRNMMQFPQNKTALWGAEEEVRDRATVNGRNYILQLRENYFFPGSNTEYESTRVYYKLKIRLHIHRGKNHVHTFTFLDDAKLYVPKPKHTESAHACVSFIS